MGERTGYLSESEVKAIQRLHKAAPYCICNVSQGQFSIARYYGGVTIGECGYVYIPQFDELVRADVLKFVEKKRALLSKRDAKASQAPEQTSLFADAAE